ncbi:MAG: hypothetical protein ACJAYU_000885 [Bradymonadia bacterium]|jgi:hypothetical protein
MSDLHAARLQCHWAAQIAGAPGLTLLKPEPNDAHTNLFWSDELGGLAGPNVNGIVTSFHFAPFEIRAGEKTLPLDGVTLEQGMKWLSEIFGKTLGRGTYDMPEHPVANGAPFASSPSMAKLQTYYERGDRALSALGGTVRCWPHHFDLAILHERGEGRSFGTGMSPGDGSYADPYWYVTPWPYPADTSALPELADGEWHTDGWVGAVMSGDRDPTVFFQSAMAACDILLADKPS